MRKSLNIPATDSAVWERVKSTVSKSSILKKRVKTELLKNKDHAKLEYKSDIRNQRKVEKGLRPASNELKNPSQRSRQTVC